MSESSQQTTQVASVDASQPDTLQPPKSTRLMEAAKVHAQALSKGSPRQPVRVLRQATTAPAESGECAEIMDHLQALKRCLVSSQTRNSGTWQRTVRIETARLAGAGAAPLRATPLQTATPRSLPPATLPGPSATSSPKTTARCRTRSPAMARCGVKRQTGAGSGARSRDSSPVVRGHAQGNSCPERSSRTTPRGTCAAEPRRRPSNSPAPQRPRPSSMGPRVSST